MRQTHRRQETTGDKLTGEIQANRIIPVYHYQEEARVAEFVPASRGQALCLETGQQGRGLRSRQSPGLAELLPVLPRNPPEATAEPPAPQLGRAGRGRWHQPGHGLPLGGSPGCEKDVFS